MKDRSSNLISSALFQEYLEGVTRAQTERENARALILLQCNAELQYRLNGGSRCALCTTTVRHVVPISVERKSGKVDQYACLCTRCYEGERARSRRIVMALGEARFEQLPRERSRNGSKPFRALIALNGRARAV